MAFREVRLLPCMRFCAEAKPIFRQFMEDLYARRAASTDEAVRMDLKNDMNSVYGKTAQGACKMIPIQFHRFDQL